MNNLYIGLLRLENRAAFFVHAKASQVTPRETAEERFHTLARGWLAYPVTPTHTHLPPKSGCRGIQRGAFRRGATTPSRNPVRGAKRQRAGTQPSPSQLRAGGTPLPINNALCHSKNRRRAVSYVSTGFACLPRDATHTHLPPKSGCRCQLMVGSQIQ